MKKIMIALLVGGTLFYFKPELFSFSSQDAFDSNGNPQVWIFTFDQCGKPCTQAISLLDKRVEYKEFNMSDKNSKKLLQQLGGGNQFPYIVIGNRHLEYNGQMFIVSALAEVLGTEYLTAYEQRVMESHFYDDGTPAVVMYGASWCGYCKKMRNYFDNNNIEFTELDAEVSAKSEYAALQGTGFPLIYIGYRRIQGANIKHVEKTIAELKI